MREFEEIKFRLPEEYSWIYDIVECVRTGKRIPIDEAHLVGGRKSGKSTAYFILYFLLCQWCNPEDFGWYSFRDSVNSANNLFEDILAVADAYGVPYTCKQKNLEIKCFNHKSRVIGVNDNRKGKKARKSGLPRFGNVRYAFIFFEERFEFNEDDVAAIKEAVRSVRNDDLEVQYIILNACNPWAKNSPYISYCGKIQTWNVKLLKETGNQCGIYDVNVGNGYTKRVLMQYTNWRVAKQFLGESEIKNILDTWNYDSKRAATTDLGLPGYEDGAIYTHMLDRIVPDVVWNDDITLIGGGDFGWGRDERSGKTVFLFGGISLENGIDIYGEYVSDNHHFVKDNNVLVREVIEFYKFQMEQFLRKTMWSHPFNVRVYVDNAAVMFIQLLENERNKQGLQWLQFVKCKKYEVNDRIEFTLAMMGRQMLRLNERTNYYPVKLLRSEFELSRYADSENQKREKINDHSINAFEYLVSPYMYKFTQITNAKFNMKNKSNKVW